MIYSVFLYKFVCVPHLHILHLLGLQQTPPALFHLYTGENVGLTLTTGRNDSILSKRSALDSVYLLIYLFEG